MNIAQEKFFYKAETLNQFEIDLLIKNIESYPKANQPLLREMLYIYLFSSNGSEYLQKNGIEIFHGIIEKLAIEVLEDARSGNLQRLEDDNTKINFCKFISRQLSRTKKVKDALVQDSHSIELPHDYKDTCDLKKILYVMSFMLSEGIGNWIYSNANIYLLKNTSQVNLITCDQPVYNIKAIKNVIPEEVELFYPVSPQYAIFITANKSIDVNLETKDVESFNYSTYMNAYELLFATTRTELEKYT